jgi:AcrR family transcriptional regulator
MAVGDGAWREQALQARRARLTEAMAAAVCEADGFAGVSVSAVCARAGVSRRAFYAIFDSREACFLAVLDEGHRRVTLVVAQAFERSSSWRDGMRLAQAELLMFFDSHPQLARVCVVESLAAGPWALVRREQHVAAFQQMIAGHPDLPKTSEPYPFASAGVIASSLGVIHSHLRAGGTQPLIGLLGSVMGLTMAPYLDSEALADEVRQSTALGRELLASRPGQPSPGPRGAPDIPALLLDPRAHHARGAVLFLADHPGASNRRVARGLGVASDTQISTLLARLASAGLLLKRKAKPGGANAWSLTPHGRSIASALQGGPSATKDADSLKASRA